MSFKMVKIMKIIPPDLCGITKPFTSIEIPYCELNEIESNHVLRKFERCSNNGFKVLIIRKTKNICFLFHLQD